MVRAFSIPGIFMAHAGAEKMDAQGYTMSVNPFDAKRGWRKARITTPEGKTYLCSVGEFWYCGCPACSEHGICKHQVWLMNKFNDQSEEAAMWAYIEETFCPPIDAITHPGGDRY